MSQLEEMLTRLGGPEEGNRKGGSRSGRGGWRSELSELEGLILASDVRSAPILSEGESEVTSEAWKEAVRAGRQRLANAIGCGVDEIDEVAAAREDWDELVVNARVELGLTTPSLMDANWDTLEQVAVTKLLILVKSNSVNNVDQLLAIAKTANGANRGTNTGRRPVGGGGGGFGVDVNLGIGIGDTGMPKDTLPSGNLGTIQLSINRRVQEQITTPRENGRGRVLDSIEMLDLQAIQHEGSKTEDSGK